MLPTLISGAMVSKRTCTAGLERLGEPVSVIDKYVSSLAAISASPPTTLVPCKTVKLLAGSVVAVGVGVGVGVPAGQVRRRTDTLSVPELAVARSCTPSPLKSP